VPGLADAAAKLCNCIHLCYLLRKSRSGKMAAIKDLNPQFITNEAGEKISVVLPISKFEELLEDIEDLAIVAERREEGAITHEELLTELKRDGLI
jgi:hypothetical protein